MAKNKTRDWTDHISSSGMPEDEMTFQTGNNYGLDAFQFDTPDNQGPEDGGRLPTTRGMAGLPDGTIPMDREADFSFVDLTDDSADGLGMDFTAMMSEEEGGLDRNASIIDLQWLDPTQAPDLNRLPNNEKTLNSIPYLEEAWGGDMSSTGIALVPNTDREAAQYRASSTNRSVGAHKTAEEVKTAIQLALRRAHYGESFNAIQSELAESLGHDAIRAASAMRVIKDDHGLIGKVFIRASAFPGIKNGKWVDRIKSKMAGARYVITDDLAIAVKLGMKMVTEVPWTRALAYYAPRLSAAGYKVASVGNPKEILRRALQIGPVSVPLGGEIKPVVKPVIATADEAMSAIRSAQNSIPEYIATANDHAIAAKRKMALVQLARWVKEGKLSQIDALRIRDTGASAPDMLRTGAIIVSTTQNVKDYDGFGARLPKNAQMLRSQALASLEQKTAALEAAEMGKAQLKLAGVVRSGMLTVGEAKRVASMSNGSAELNTNMAAAVQAATAMRQVHHVTVKVADYSGIIQKAAYQNKVGDVVHLDQFMQSVTKVAANSGIKVSEILGYLKWTRQKMAEGEMGRDLTAFIKGRFAKPLRLAARDLIKEIRSTHEGLSGHLYVDAEAYASKTGTTGCEQGAAIHRTNNIKHVLAMKRCAGCVFANANGVCQQYNKRLASKPPVDDVKSYQAEVLKLADAHEAEVVASMFSPNEFGLRNEPLEDLHISSFGAPEELGDVLFGGMEV